LKQNINKLKLISIVIITLILIPVLLAGVESDYKDPLNKRSTIGLFNSPVYYEDTTGYSWGVHVSGDYAYVADRESGLAVIDISDPTNPGTPVYEDTDGEANDVFVSGDYAYIADGSEGFAVIDISNPTNPGTPIYEGTIEANGVYVSGDYAYLADTFWDFVVIDISDPTNPGTPITEATTGVALSIYVSGDYAYVADYSSGLAVIDISDPTNPSTPIYEDTNGYARDVFVSGDYAYVADDHAGLAVIDISDPTDPGAPVYMNTAGNAHGVWVCGDHAYVTDGSSGLAIIDITDPINPGTPIYESTTDDAMGIYISGNYAYVAADYDGLAVIPISKPIDPTTPVYEDTTGSASDVYVSGDYAYVADGYSGLAVIDISDPTNPGAPVYEDTTGSAHDVYVNGDYAYVADWGSGLAVIDISDPTNPGPPVYRDTLDMSDHRICVDGDFVYMAGLDSIEIINISDPTNPGTPVYIYTSNVSYDVCVSGDYAYVAGDLGGLGVIDISDPTNPGTPIYVRMHPSVNLRARGVCVSGDYAYVAAGTAFFVIDISDPTNPGTPVGESTLNNAYDVYVDGDYAFVAGDYTGLEIFDISNPTNPEPYVTEDTNGNAYSVSISGDYAYVADDASGLAVIQVRERWDRKDPIITNTPSDFTIELGYTGETISWTATDTHPNNYTIELQGSGIVEGPLSWSNGSAITYDVPEGLSVGEYFYTVNFSDDYDNFVTDTVKMTVQDTSNPLITSAPSDFNADYGYTDETISWTATDPNPHTYTIELQGSGIVEGPTAWLSGVAVVYNVPDGFGIGDLFYTINFTDDYDNFVTDTVKMTINEIDDPIITISPSDFTIESGYTGETISWTATDDNPNTYTVELQDSGIVEGPTAWSSGVAIIYNIPDGLAVGEYFYTINFTDDYGRYVTDTVKVTVQDTTNPVITSLPSDFTIELGYTGETISWTATDLNPHTYIIELQGSGIVEGPTAWSSGVAIIYNIPDDLTVGEYLYTVNFTDGSGNYVTDTITVTVRVPSSTPEIPFGNLYLIFIAIGIIAVVIVQKRRN